MSTEQFISAAFFGVFVGAAIGYLIGIVMGRQWGIIEERAKHDRAVIEAAINKQRGHACD